jgi:single-strand DNA-binding protein
MNICIFTGRLTRDPESRQAGGSTVTSFGLAVDDSYKNKSTGDTVDQAVFLDFECWGKRGEVLSNYCKKGDELKIQARAKQDQWETDGVKRSKVLFTVMDFEFGRKKGQNKDDGNG